MRTTCLIGGDGLLGCRLSSRHRFCFRVSLDERWFVGNGACARSSRNVFCMKCAVAFRYHGDGEDIWIIRSYRISLFFLSICMSVWSLGAFLSESLSYDPNWMFVPFLVTMSFASSILGRLKQFF